MLTIHDVYCVTFALLRFITPALSVSLTFSIKLWLLFDVIFLFTSLSYIQLRFANFENSAFSGLKNLESDYDNIWVLFRKRVWLQSTRASSVPMIMFNRGFFVGMVKHALTSQIRRFLHHAEGLPAAVLFPSILWSRGSPRKDHHNEGIMRKAVHENGVHRRHEHLLLLWQRRLCLQQCTRGCSVFIMEPCQVNLMTCGQF